MPLPTAAELTDPNATNTQMKQRLGQLAENVGSKENLRALNNGKLPSITQSERKSLATISGYLNASGTLAGAGDANWKTSDFISLNSEYPISCFMVGTASMKSICFYNDSKAFISAVGTNSVQPSVISADVEIPVDAKYFRFTVATLSLSTANAQDVNSQTIKTAVIDISYILERMNKLNNGVIDVVDGSLNDLYTLMTLAGYVNSSGIFVSDANWLSSDFIESAPGEVVNTNLIGHTTIASIAFYDSTKTLLTKVSGTEDDKQLTASLTAPENTAYVRVSGSVSYGGLSVSPVAKRKISMNVVAELKKLKPKVEKNISEIEQNKAKIEVIESGNFQSTTQLLSALTQAGYINASGTVTSDPNFKNTDFIAVKPGETVKIKLIAHTVVSSIAFYNSNKVLLTKVSGTSVNQILTTELTAPENTAFVRVSGATAVGSISVTDAYIKKTGLMNVTTEIEKLKEGSVSKQEYSLLAPVAVYTTCNDVGTATNKGRLRNYSASIYLDHMLNGLTSEKHIRFKDAVDKFTFVAPIVVTDSNETNPAVTLNNGVNANEAATAIVVQGNDIITTTLNVKHRSAKNSVTASAFPKVLCIGDSITYGEMATLPDDGFTQNHAYHLIAKELFMKDKIDNGNSGFDCLFLGTKSKSKTANYAGNTLTVNTKHEGVRGRTIAQHLDGTDTTFWDSVNSKFSINAWLSKYRTLDDNGNRLNVGNGTGSLINAGNREVYDVCTPTHVLIALGMNNGGTLAQFQTMINSIRTELPNVIIGIAIPDAAGTYFPSLHPNCSKECTIWNDTGAQGSRKNQQYNLLKTLQDYYGTSYESQNIYLMPFYHTAPTAESVAFRKVDQLDAEYSSILESEFRQHYGWHASTHTNALGHINWGYQLYSWIKWTIAKSV